MKKKTYDLVIGMGSMCSCSQSLRGANLQLMSMPFDWNGGPGILGKTELMVNNFSGFIQRDRMVRNPEPKNSYNQYWADNLGFKYYHDFPAACDFETELVKVQQKYRRRIDRLYDVIGSAKEVLIVYVACRDWADCTSDEAAICRKRLAERWPSVHFDFLLFRYAEGVSLRNRKDESVEGCRTVTFDYLDRKEEGWRADYHLLGKWLSREYAVRDYRTPEERKLWESRDRREAYARFKATNLFQLFWHKTQFKVYKHLRTRLERLGII